MILLYLDWAFLKNFKKDTFKFYHLKYKQSIKHLNFVTNNSFPRLVIIKTNDFGNYTYN